MAFGCRSTSSSLQIKHSTPTKALITTPILFPFFFLRKKSVLFFPELQERRSKQATLMSHVTGSGIYDRGGPRPWPAEGGDARRRRQGRRCSSEGGRRRDRGGWTWQRWRGPVGVARERDEWLSWGPPYGVWEENPLQWGCGLGLGGVWSKIEAYPFWELG